MYEFWMCDLHVYFTVNIWYNVENASLVYKCRESVWYYIYVKCNKCLSDFRIYECKDGMRDARICPCKVHAGERESLNSISVTKLAIGSFEQALPFMYMKADCFPAVEPVWRPRIRTLFGRLSEGQIFVNSLAGRQIKSSHSSIPWTEKYHSLRSTAFSHQPLSFKTRRVSANHTANHTLTHVGRTFTLEN